MGFRDFFFLIWKTTHKQTEYLERKKKVKRAFVWVENPLPPTFSSDCVISNHICHEKWGRRRSLKIHAYKKSKNVRLESKHNKQEAWLGFFANKQSWSLQGLTTWLLGIIWQNSVWNNTVYFPGLVDGINWTSSLTAYVQPGILPTCLLVGALSI